MSRDPDGKQPWASRLKKRHNRVGYGYYESQEHPAHAAALWSLRRKDADRYLTIIMAAQT